MSLLRSAHYHRIFAVGDVACGFKIAGNMVHVCEFVSNLLTAAQHICSCSAKKPDNSETSRATAPVFG